MTRKDYVLLATTLNKASQIHVQDDFQRGKVAGVAVAAEFIADALASDNKRFDRAHFIAVVRGDKAPNSKPERKNTEFDFSVQDEGTIVILYVHTEAGRGWVTEHIPDDHQTWGQNGIVIEHRFAHDILEGIKEADLTIE